MATFRISNSAAKAVGNDVLQTLRIVSHSNSDEPTTTRQFQQCAEAISGVMAVTFVAGSQAIPPLTPQAELVFDGDENKAAILEISQQAAVANRRITNNHPHVRNVRLTACPIHLGPVPKILVAAVVPGDDEAETAGPQLETVAYAMNGWICKRLAEQSAIQLNVTAAAVELIEKLEQCASVREACLQLANEIKEFTDCQFVAVGLCKRPNGRCHTEVIHGSSQLNRNSPLVRSLNELLSETVARGEITTIRRASPESAHAVLAHKAFVATQDYQSATSIPLIASGERICGVLAVGGFSKQVEAPACAGLLRSAGPLIGSTLDLLRDAASSPARAASAARRWLTPLTIFAGILVLFLGLMFVPVSHRISCDCIIEPLARRICVSPYDGLISSAFVEVGSEVIAGDILAEMESREIRWELASLQAKAAQSIKKRDTEMIAGNVLESQLAELELGQIQARETMLQARLKNKSIVAPISGIILTGTIENVTNAAVKIGDPIYEIAPLGSMIVEVAVPESEVDFLIVGQTTKMTFRGGSRITREGTIHEVHPQAEIRNGQNVFVATVELDNSDHRLRPGVAGTARVSAGSATVGWVLFHRAWDRICVWWPL